VSFLSQKRLASSFWPHFDQRSNSLVNLCLASMLVKTLAKVTGQIELASMLVKTLAKDLCWPAMLVKTSTIPPLSVWPCGTPGGHKGATEILGSQTDLLNPW
jgi:hypothetical protein